MNSQDQVSASCCRSVQSLGGVLAEDFSVLDKLAVKLICLDPDLEAPLRQIGERIGGRIAAQLQDGPLPIEVALLALIQACGLEGVIESRFQKRSPEEDILQITGCSTVLGWQVPNLGRSVCTFDAGLFEGFLRAATGRGDVTVDELACLGRGEACCEFRIYHQPIPIGEWHGVAHGNR